MAKWRLRIPILGLMLVCFIATAFAVRMPADEVQQPLAANVGDLATVSRIEVRDHATPLLSGEFGAETTDDDEIKREATLTSAGAGAAKGNAEIELDAADRTEQELEVEVEGLAPRATYQIVIDGQLAGTMTTDARGRGNIELSRGTNDE